MVRKHRMTFCMLTIVLLSSLCLGYELTRERGCWPDSWPKELEPYRTQAKTIEFRSGFYETMHVIEFRQRVDFEKAWPHILKLKSKGAPLILDGAPSKTFGSTCQAGVRILCPSPDVISGTANGKGLAPGPPWPDDIKSNAGELPEYVVNQDDRWVPSDRVTGGGFRHRARVDLTLVVDGKIVDLNRIPLPADTPIIDRRFEKEAKPSHAE